MALHVREIERGDLPVINRWRNDAEVVAYLGANFFFIASEIDGRWYDRYLAERDKAVRLAMMDGPDGALIGCVNLTNIHRVNRSAELSIVIGEKSYWGKGYGAAATDAILKHGFFDLNLHRIYLDVLATNDRAIRTYVKCGFREEGRHREAVYKNGRFIDVISMALLEEEFRRTGPN
jgi:diamine N-acetyltransferase